VNVSVGREGAPQPASPAAECSVVVGGGPAGLQAACTVAERGHHEVLYERGDALSDASAGPESTDLSAITDWLADRAERPGIKLVLGKEMTAEGLALSGADAVIIAAGAQALLPGRQRFRPATPILVDDVPPPASLRPSSALPCARRRRSYAPRRRHIGSHQVVLAEHRRTARESVP
jgi:hypothetical protein